VGSPPSRYDLGGSEAKRAGKVIVVGKGEE